MLDIILGLSLSWWCLLFVLTFDGIISKEKKGNSMLVFCAQNKSNILEVLWMIIYGK